MRLRQPIQRGPRRAVALGLLGLALAAPLAAIALAGPASGARPEVAAAYLGAVAVRVPDEPGRGAAPPAPAGPRADAALRREGRDFIGGGFLSVPASFSSADGGYDLVIHFHGNMRLVEESYHASGVDAAVLILNHGDGSSAYERRFFHPAILSGLLGEVDAALTARGLRGARLSRIALSSWSAGYGAVVQTLNQPELAERVSAVLLLDGLHCGYNGDGSLAMERVAPLQRFARRATAGERLLVITHSEIKPVGNYAGSGEVTDALLAGLGVRREPLAAWPPLPALASLRGVLPAERLRPLDPLTQALAGGLVVRGYAGGREEHHVMHLAQMAVIALPELVRYWSTPG